MIKGATPQLRKANGSKAVEHYKGCESRDQAPT